jgi:hypothetical protein
MFLFWPALCDCSVKQTVKRFGSQVLLTSRPAANWAPAAGVQPEIESMQKIVSSAKAAGLDKILADLPTYKVPSIDQLYDIGTISALPPSPDQQAVTLLARVHAELEGLARLTVESGLQIAAMVETTKANLTALQNVIDELKESHKSADRSSNALFWLTVAIFVTGAIVALAAAPQIVGEIQNGLGWIASLRR